MAIPARTSADPCHGNSQTEGRDSLLQVRKLISAYSKEQLHFGLKCPLSLFIHLQQYFPKFVRGSIPVDAGF